VYFSSDHQILI